MKQSKPEDFLTQRTQSISAKDASSNKCINKIYPDYFALIFPLFSAARLPPIASLHWGGVAKKKPRNQNETIRIFDTVIT
jgi:hypothetical protein